MTNAELKAHFEAILNRSDITDALATTFLTLGMKRAERKLRVTFQETSADSVAASFVSLPVPANLVGVISLSVDNKDVAYLPLSKFNEIDDTSSGQPVYWTRKAGTIYMKPLPTDGAASSLFYYSTFAAFTDDATISAYSLAAPDLIIYAALKFAADYYIDERAQAWDATFLECVDDLQSTSYMADGEAQVQPAYALDCD